MVRLIPWGYKDIERIEIMLGLHIGYNTTPNLIHIFTFRF